MSFLEKFKSLFLSKPFEFNIYSPVDGVVLPQKEIPDEGFSENHMGVGLGIDPTHPSVSSPCSGKLAVLFKTKHAYIIQDERSGISVMLHLGIDTVNIKPELKAFKTHLKQDEYLNAKDPLCEIDIDVIKENAKSTVSALLIQNENMDGKKVIFHQKSGNVKKGDLLMSIIEDR